MRRPITILFLLLAAFLHAQSLVDYVNPLVGTDNANTGTAGMFGKGSEEMGQTLPAVLVPNGMNFWTPQTQDTEVKCKAPYYYRDRKIQGFRASHWIVGGCTQDYGSVTLMPLSGKRFEGRETNRRWLPEERASRFSHDEETTRPDYYRVWLQDYGIEAEMTGLSHTGMFRFTYPGDSAAWLVVNPNSDEGQGYIEILPERRQIRGFNPAHRIYQGKGQPCGFSGYFIIQLPRDCTWEDYGCYHADTTLQGSTRQQDKALIGAWLKVKPSGKPLLVKVATSFVDWEGCERNLQAEIPHWDFTAVQQQARNSWEEQLGQIRVKPFGENAGTELRKFYTALYHASFLPREFSDADGRYPSFAGGRQVMQMPTGKKYYDDFSMWDTYRALHPLLNILHPDKAGEMMQSLVLKYVQGGWLPIFPCWNSYTAAMIGDHCISVLSDAIVKDIPGFDTEKAIEAMRRNAFTQPETRDEYENGMGRRALDSYIQYGYIPLEDSVMEAYHKREQVSRTMEYAYDDYALAQAIRHLMRGRHATDYGQADGNPAHPGQSLDRKSLESDYKTLTKRSRNYRNIISPYSGYAQGRHADGSFVREANQDRFCTFITEGAPCHYTFYVPHDVPGLVKAMGGRKAFILRLDSLFSEHRYWHGNEPCHQIPFLYDYIGQPEKTRTLVRHILQTEYNDTPGGLSGNDDAGQMSAWYVFSAMGVYPVCPGTTEYAVSSPVFSEVEIRLPQGKVFTIKNHDNPATCTAMPRMILNGKSRKKPFIEHRDIMEGGILEFLTQE